MVRLKRPNKASIHRENEQKDIQRQHQAALLYDSRPISHREAERIWKEARRSLRSGEVVTSWAGLKT